MTTDTIFHIYSMTKPITSVAVMMLWEEGAFGLYDPIGLYLPEFKDVRVAVEDESGSSIIDTVTAKRPITIQDLLRHTSGMTYGIFGQMTPVKLKYLDAGLAIDTLVSLIMSETPTSTAWKWKCGGQRRKTWTSAPDSPHTMPSWPRMP